MRDFYHSLTKLKISYKPASCCNPPYSAPDAVYITGFYSADAYSLCWWSWGGFSSCQFWKTLATCDPIAIISALVGYSVHIERDVSQAISWRTATAHKWTYEKRSHGQHGSSDASKEEESIVIAKRWKAVKDLQLPTTYLPSWPITLWGLGTSRISYSYAYTRKQAENCLRSHTWSDRLMQRCYQRPLKQT